MGLLIYGLEDAEKQTRTNLLRELPLFGKVGTTLSREERGEIFSRKYPLNGWTY
jgi:hypothetical protein